MPPERYPVELPAAVSIREASREDATAIAGVYEAAYPPNTDYPYVDQEHVVADLLEPEDFRVFVAETGGNPVGVAAIEYDAINAGNAQICKLAVVPDAQGQGLGSALLKYRLNVLAADPVPGLVFSGAVTSHAASQANLEKRDFVPCAFQRAFLPELFGGGEECAVIMAWRPGLSDPEQPLVLPPEYEQIASQCITNLDGRGRKIEPMAPDTAHSDPVDVTVSRGRDYLFDISAGGDYTWSAVREMITETAARREDSVMITLDAHDESLLPLYADIRELGFSPSGLLPEWATVDGQNRDVMAFYEDPGLSVSVSVTDGVHDLIGSLSLAYTVTEQSDRGLELHIEQTD